MRRSLLILALALPSSVLADDGIHEVNRKATAEIDVIHREDIAEKQGLRDLLEGGVLRDEARATLLIDRILLNGSRVAAIQLQHAQELRHRLTAAEFAKLVLEQR
jgi:hypothetical protein